MNKIKDYSLSKKILIPFVVIGLLLVVNFLVFDHLKKKKEVYAFQSQLLLKTNQLHFENVYFASLIAQGKYASKNDLKNNAKQQKDLFFIISDGGTVPHDIKNTALPPVDIHFRFFIDTILDIQKIYSANIYTVLNEPLSTGEYKIKAAFESIKIYGYAITVFSEHLQELLNSNSHRIKAAQMVAQLIYIILFSGCICLIIYIFRRDVVKPLEKISRSLKQIYWGNISSNEVFLEKGGDEIGQTNILINQIVGRLRKTTRFVTDIGNEKFDSEYKVYGETDILGSTLQDMRDSFIQKAEEENKRKVEDHQRNWINTGLNKFSDILRMHTDNLEELGYNIISNLVKYLEANQGGVFIYNDDDPENKHLDLIASIAYDRRKYINKKVAPGDGLLGTCLLEKETIYLNNLPQEYIEIESGLGDANPNYLLITPLKMEDRLLGVIELASFYKLEKYQIDFIEQVGESIAATLSSSKMNSQTAQLLEQAQEQAEELHAQEEEMRQNMEELQATQEESDRKAEEMQGLLDAIDNSTGTFELDLEGYLINVNSAMLSMLNATKAQIIGMEHRAMVESNFTEEDGYDEIWEKLKNGIPYKGEFKVNIKIGEIWLDMAYTPVVNNDGVVQKILVLAANITLKKVQEMEMQDNLEMLKMQDEQLRHNLADLDKARTELKEKEKKLEENIQNLNQENEAKEKIIDQDIEYSRKVLEGSNEGVVTLSIEGKIEFFNRAAQILWGFAPEEVKGKKIENIVADNYDNFFDNLKQLSGSGLEVNIKHYEGHTIETFFNIIETKQKNQYKYTLFVRDISSQKMADKEKTGAMEEVMTKEFEYQKKIRELEAEIKKLKPNNKSNEKKDKPSAEESKPGKTLSQETETVAETLIDWSDEFSVELQSIDDQHKKLVDIINKLYKAFKDKSASELLQEIVFDLAEYARYHFSFEEKYFKEYKFKEAEKHITEHQGFVKKIGEFQKEIEEGKVKTPYEVMNFLRDWLLNHILKSDKKYSELFKNKGMK